MAFNFSGGAEVKIRAEEITPYIKTGTDAGLGIITFPAPDAGYILEITHLCANDHVTDSRFKVTSSGSSPIMQTTTKTTHGVYESLDIHVFLIAPKYIQIEVMDFTGGDVIDAYAYGVLKRM